MAKLGEIPEAEPKEVCKVCVDITTNIFFKHNDWKGFNAKYCVTECTNYFIPEYIPKEQVIKYLKEKLN